MSISSPGENRQVNVVKTGKSTATGGKPGGSAGSGAPKKTSGGSGRPSSGGSGRPSSGGKGPGGKGRKPITPMKVTEQRAWGPIALLTTVILIAVAIVGFGAFFIIKDM